MQRLLVVVVLAAACHHAPASGAALAGADSPRAAVERFLAAAKAQDLQAVSSVWGDETGLARDRFTRQELEKRELIMVYCLRHDQYRIGEPEQGEGGHLTLAVDLTLGQMSATSRFTAAKGASNRWFVQNFETVALQNKGFCRRA